MKTSAVLQAWRDGGCVERPAYTGLLLMPGVGLCVAPLHQLGQEGQHLVRIPQCVAGVCGLHLQGTTCSKHNLFAKLQVTSVSVSCTLDIPGI